MTHRVIVIGPSRQAKGGVVSVIASHEKMEFWNYWHCVWIESYIDGPLIKQIIFFIKNYLIFIYYLFQCEIVHIHLSWHFSAIRKFPFFILARIFRKKVIIQLHSGAGPIIDSNYKFLYNYIFTNANCTVIIAKTIYEALVKTYKFKHFEIIYNPCNDQNYSCIEKTNSKIILFAATLKTEKGYEDLLHAFSIIARSFPDWKIIFAGNGEVEKGKEMASSLGIADQVIFKGWLEGTSLQTLFTEAMIFCLPSYNEGFPMAILDAWAYGLPVITTPVGGLLDVLNNENSLIFIPGDIEMLAKHIRTLIVDDNLRNKIGNASKYLGREVFNPNLISKNIFSLYENLINNNISVVSG